VAGALSLAACGPTEDARWQCKYEAGPEPNSGLGAFGAIGTLAKQSTDRHAAWRQKFATCMHGKLPDWKEPWP